jgi:hypothetical protein
MPRKPIEQNYTEFGLKRAFAIDFVCAVTGIRPEWRHQVISILDNTIVRLNNKKPVLAKLLAEDEVSLRQLAVRNMLPQKLVDKIKNMVVTEPEHSASVRILTAKISDATYRCVPELFKESHDRLTLRITMLALEMIKRSQREPVANPSVADQMGAPRPAGKPPAATMQHQ